MPTVFAENDPWLVCEVAKARRRRAGTAAGHHGGLRAISRPGSWCGIVRGRWRYCFGWGGGSHGDLWAEVSAFNRGEMGGGLTTVSGGPQVAQFGPDRGRPHREQNSGNWGPGGRVGGGT